jgi:outer membrane protein OmpA-like peptidoglycan-associated protein
MKLATDLFKAPRDSFFSRGLSVIVVLILCAFTVNAQTREGRWMLGVQGGGHTLYSDFDKHAYDVGGEVLLRYGLSEHFSLGFFTGYNDIRGETPYPLAGLNGLSLDMYTIPAAVVGWWHFTSMKTVSPYVYIGAGLVDMKKRDNFGNYPPDGRWHVYSVFPAGLGLEVPLSSAATLGFDVGMRVFGSDAVDLVEVAAPPDAYGTARVGLNFYFGEGKAAEVEEAAPVVLPPPAPVEKPAAPALPLPPELVTPANGATGVATNPTLTWNASSGATSYRLQASTDPTFALTTADQTGVTTTSYSLSGLATGTTYYWHVIATNSAGSSAYSTTWSFTTTAPPPPTVPVVPKEAPVVIEKGKGFILEGVNFEFDSAKLTEEAVSILGKALTALQDHPDVKVNIVGHTDNVGSKKYNDRLSLRRANSVKSWLVSKGISATRITTAGVGFSEPVASNDTPEGRAKNRRIEFHVEE